MPDSCADRCRGSLKPKMAPYVHMWSLHPGTQRDPHPTSFAMPAVPDPCYGHEPNVILYTGPVQGARLEYDMLRSFRVHQSMSLIPASKTSPVPVRCTTNFEGLCVFQAYLRSTGHSSAIAIALTLMARQIDGGHLPVFQCAPHATGISLSLAVQETLAFRLRRKGCPRGKT